MRQPEMAHTPAYYHDNGQLMTTFLHDPRTPEITTTPAPAPHPPPAPVAAAHRLSGVSSVQEGPYHTYRHHYPHHSLSGSMGSQLEPPAPASSHLENGSVVTRESNSSRRKERARGSLSERSSYMSGERPSRTPKRPVYDDAPVPDDNQDALVMLFRLSIPVPVVAFATCLYTIFGLLFAILVSPLRLCPPTAYLKETSFRTQICDLLAPALHVHERLVGLKSFPRRSSSQWVYDDDPDTSTSSPSSEDRNQAYSVGGLIVVLLLSPFLSLALLLTVWIAASFWVFAMVLGNPDGTERKDDGRAAVLGVCRWWQKWLGKARRKSR
ncbi:uncharacterized protein EURHEDRAFT_301251 [Aspergillus ruber CBS 135680]|uniref:Uncharacterized protein n=1 Tax=Aspergillus ruber (strain CBS 135680) TaxID=1388766 RepID=A0A017SL36_ASPRC|nr:uncharacterized protein EURHEDRAFT_301251 [Aspergillus ruber CBS 135680]EYE97637.1 hypothetical protein EURHEDRAFT_301251 [Aspergillus ruber CBS 135680]